MNNQNAIVYRIQQGDTLYSLAGRYNTTVESIYDSNPHLDPHRLKIGDEIIIYPRQNGLTDLTESKLNLMDNMRMFFDDHVMWMRQMIISVAHDLRDTDAIYQELLAGSNDVETLFRTYYGADIANRVATLYREHILIGREYFKALRNNNMTNVENFNREWYKNADDIAFTLDSINPYYVEKDIRDLLYQYLDLMRQLASTRMGSNYTADIRLFENARIQVETLADYLTNGIIEQFPQQFIS